MHTIINGDIKKRPVLIVSTKIDSATDAVTRNLRNSGHDLIRFNTEDYPYEVLSSATISMDDFKGLSVSYDKINGPFKSIWWRRLRSPENPEKMHQKMHQYCIQESQAFTIGVALSLSEKIMSPPEKVWSAEHKIYQLEVARRCGLKIPPTIISNDPARIREFFYSFNKKIVCKVIRSGFIDFGDEKYSIYTNLILEEHLENISSARLSPSIYQYWIRKFRDIRVTVVDNKIFTASIDSSTDPDSIIDWRKAKKSNIHHEVFQLPKLLESQILKFMNALGLKFGALDFALTHEGEYFFLEVNPNGQWLWLEDKLNLGITDAISDWLSSINE